MGMLRGGRKGRKRDDGVESWSDHEMSILAIAIGDLVHPGCETEYD